MDKLIVIDMQNQWLANPRAPCLDTAGVAARINHAAAAVRARKGVVIFVQHANEEAAEGSDGWQIIPALQRASGDRFIRKQACDSFADTDLGRYLADEADGTIYLCGFATEFCVDTTVRAAASRGLHVVVLADAHTTSRRPHLDAASIIAHHNWVWSNMAVPSSSSLAVMGTAEAFP